MDVWSSFAALGKKPKKGVMILSLARVGLLSVIAGAAVVVGRDYPGDAALVACPGYNVSNIKTTATGLTANLSLAGTACNAYGIDLTSLILEVSYDTGIPDDSSMAQSSYGN
jgi:hypothetical protein